MPMLFRTSRLSAGAAISVAAACAIAARASAQVPAPLVIGPDRVGSAVTYRLTTSDGRAGSAPNVQTLALRWKLGQKVVVTLTTADDARAMPYVATRATDGRLTLDNVNADDPEGQRNATAVGVLNRLVGFVAAAPAGAKKWKMTLGVQAPAPRANRVPDAQSTQAPQPLKILVAAARSDDATGTTLAASGSIDRTVTRPAAGGSPRGGGGGMGGGRMGGSSSGPRSIKVTTKITIDAHVGRDGGLTSSRPSLRAWKDVTSMQCSSTNGPLCRLARAASSRFMGWPTSLPQDGLLPAGQRPPPTPISKPRAAATCAGPRTARCGNSTSATGD